MDCRNKIRAPKYILLLVINCLFLCQLFSQDIITFHGIITNASDGERISYATVSVVNQPIGVVSNEQGEFKFHVPSKYETDSVIISCLGFKSFKKCVDDINENEVYQIKLKPELYLLAEITITAKVSKNVANHIVKRAIEKISENYNTKPFLLCGYYREYLKNDEGYKNILEAAIEVEDPGFGLNEFENKKVRLRQFRINTNFQIDSQKMMSYDNLVRKYIPGAYINPMGGNEFSILRSHDPIRNYNRFSMSFINKFSRGFVRNHELKIDSVTLLDGKSIFCISFQTSYMFKTDELYNYEVNGNIFIRADNYAIVKMYYALFIDYYRQKLKLYDMKVEYREYRKKMYLNYLMFGNYFETEKSLEQGLYQYREFFVNNIITHHYDPITTEQLISNKTPLFNNRVENIANFWETYNHIITRPLLKN